MQTGELGDSVELRVTKIHPKQFRVFEVCSPKVNSLPIAIFEDCAGEVNARVERPLDL